MVNVVVILFSVYHWGFFLYKDRFGKLDGLQGILKALGEHESFIMLAQSIFDLYTFLVG